MSLAGINDFAMAAMTADELDTEARRLTREAGRVARPVGGPVTLRRLRRIHDRQHRASMLTYEATLCRAVAAQLRDTDVETWVALTLEERQTAIDKADADMRDLANPNTED